MNEKKSISSYLVTTVFVSFFILFYLCLSYNNIVDCNNKAECNKRDKIKVLHMYADRLNQAKERFYETRIGNPTIEDLLENVDDSSFFYGLYNGLPFYPEYSWNVDSNGEIFLEFSKPNVTEYEKKELCADINYYSLKLEERDENSTLLSCNVYNNIGFITIKKR